MATQCPTPLTPLAQATLLWVRTSWEVFQPKMFSPSRKWPAVRLATSVRRGWARCRWSPRTRPRSPSLMSSHPSGGEERCRGERLRVDSATAIADFPPAPNNSYHTTPPWPTQTPAVAGFMTAILSLTMLKVRRWQCKHRSIQRNPIPANSSHCNAVSLSSLHRQYCICWCHHTRLPSPLPPRLVAGMLADIRVGNKRLGPSISKKIHRVIMAAQDQAFACV